MQSPSENLKAYAGQVSTEIYINMNSWAVYVLTDYNGKLLPREFHLVKTLVVKLRSLHNFHRFLVVACVQTSPISSHGKETLPLFYVRKEIGGLHAGYRSGRTRKDQCRPNYTTVMHTFVIATSRLGLGAPLVTRNDDNNKNNNEPLDYEQSLFFLIVRRERSEKNRSRESWPRESWWQGRPHFRPACFFCSALDKL